MASGRTETVTDGEQTIPYRVSVLCTAAESRVSSTEHRVLRTKYSVLYQSCSHAAMQPCSHAAMQPCNQATKQPSSQAAKQPGSQAARQNLITWQGVEVSSLH